MVYSKMEKFPGIQFVLFTFLDNPTDRCLTLYSTYFHKELKHQENSLNSSYVPKFLRDYGVTLQALNKVTESKDFKALHNQLEVKLETLRCDWTMRYALPTEKLNIAALKRRFLASFCKLLSNAATGFVALTGIKNYSGHEAVLDLLVSTPSIVITEPFATSITEFLRVYKTVNKLQYISSPTIENTF